MDNLQNTAKEISEILKKKLPTIEIIESSSTQGTSVAKVRLGSEIRYLPLFNDSGLSSTSIR
ncbi:MAG: hypothetical protein IM550_10745 [Microcystis sp. M54BS1]|uniref:hypothetical protein n=1 Tax=unclassified Microcystis TaxID=2643300 RepID=UPI00257F4B05|nr:MULTISPECIES: hypothetical protein [unclassified Microcystis]MCA2539687.1 hypothetical protein [Microcystis sp. M54BS1]MCA2549918.1 hypothetical protein [Microcystis sp. M53BS1]MCA2596200.1 hypothetical protein [Microcystis sp. M38BS1]MCA2612840.1 hypothetical protein [Microcystis sp. M27BS1]MCA2504931.1 hypothetical protein [Microcystis sp. M62BS1]